MIENEFLFLGLLADAPKHGYEIKRQIFEDLEPNIGLKIKSIYYPLMRMEKEGLILKESKRQGKFPEKFVYQITPKGRRKFEILMHESFSSIERPFFQIDLSLYFMHLADKLIVKRRLKARISYLRKVSHQVVKLKDRALTQKTSFYLIHQHNLDLIDAEIKSTTRLMQHV